MNRRHDESQSEMNRAPWKARAGFTLVEMLVVVAIICMLIGVLLPAIQAARESARRAQCGNNLKQMGLAMHAHHSTYGTLPCAANGRASGTWVRVLLPYMEQQEYYDRYNEAQAYNSGANVQLIRQRLAIYSCPSDTTSFTWPVHPEVGNYNYGVNLGNTTVYRAATYNGVAFSPSPFQNNHPQGEIPLYQFSHIRDGLSQTLMIGELRQGKVVGDLRGLTWFGPTCGFTAHNGPNSPTPDYLNSGSGLVSPPILWCGSDESANLPGWPCMQATTANPVNFSARSFHLGGVGVVLCDGSVRFVSDAIDVPTWRALSTMREGEVIGEF